MKVFLSWSGGQSHKIACAFRDWLPSVIQSIEPYVSSEDIDKGTRWSTDISKELEESSYGIVCVTKENLMAPWVHFEAGALSKSLDKSNVCPFLLDLKRSEVHGPLLQFQSTIYSKEEMKKLVGSLNNKLEQDGQLKAGQLDKAFEVWWPELKKVLDDIIKNESKVLIKENEILKDKNQNSESEILEQILDLVRQQQRILNDPEALIPPNYLKNILKYGVGDQFIIRGEMEELHSQIISLERYVRDCHRNGDEISIEELRRKVSEVHTLCHQVMDRTIRSARIRGRSIGRPLRNSRIQQDTSEGAIVDVINEPED